MVVKSSARGRPLSMCCSDPRCSGHIAVTTDGSRVVESAACFIGMNESEILSQGGFSIHPVSRFSFCRVRIEESGYMFDEVRLARPALLLKIGLGHRVLQ